MKIIFDIPGTPQGKARPKVVRAKNGMSLTYTPDKTVAYEELVRARFLGASENRRFDSDKQLKIIISAYYPIPKSKSKSQKTLMKSGVLRPTKKPDWDNVGKIICDSLNGIAYHDDAQIVEAQVLKYYSKDDVPFVSVLIEDINHD